MGANQGRVKVYGAQSASLKNLRSQKDKRSPRPCQRGSSVPSSTSQVPNDLTNQSEGSSRGLQSGTTANKSYQSLGPSLDQALLTEAHGLITDMLQDPALPPHITCGLRALANLLCPPGGPAKPRGSQGGSLAVEIRPTCDSQEEDLPYTGEKPSAIPKLRRHLPPSLLRRMSTSTWTTTTSATGMPTLEPEPSRKRSTSFSAALRSPSSSLYPPGDRNSLSLEPGSCDETESPSSIPENIPETRRDRLRSEGALSFGHGADEKPIKRDSLTPDGHEVRSDGRTDRLRLERRSESQRSDVLCAYCGRRSSFSQTIHEEPFLKQDKPPEIFSPSPGVFHINGQVFDTQMIRTDALLATLGDWDFPIFDLNDRDPTTILSKMCYRIFHDTGLVESFKVPEKEFLAFLHALENGYRDKPYHNRMHAADVLHGVYYLTSQPIPGLEQIPVTDSTQPEFGQDSPMHQTYFAQSYSCDANLPYGIMGINFPALELMALYLAAVIHDFDHPGRTNAFLVTTHAPQAILYNDRSVLENHHAAAAWSLLLSRPEFDFLRNLDKAEFKRLRYLVIECVLATDLKRHFEILAEFTAKMNMADSAGLDWTNEADRLLVSEMAIKLSDINGPCKRRDIHVQWTRRIEQEFYEQGDEEQRLGLPVSPFMDRSRPQLAKLQESFIKHLVAPLCNAYGQAGLLPGEWVSVDGDHSTSLRPPSRHGTNGNPDDEASSSDTNLDDDEAKEDEEAGDTGKPNSQRSNQVVCLQTKHLQDNYAYWIKVLEKEHESSASLKEGDGEEADAEDC
ncbi:cGMP-inhibited 3',5'-cyclic phosphodiesterase A-like isoform X2 [Varroa destructor]|uniref:Phosphodiesterase n=1 Tax=Varroa destructor TaxID=109461 RepID=A0A7M7JCY1_VARDE|nr:cGMP-inhibited 3',5'-cyclic phosphodiesterase A-like isoform X2 [Varroa destructor]